MKGSLIHENSLLVIPSETIFSFVKLPGLYCYDRILTDTCSELDRVSSITCKAGSNSSPVSYLDFTRQRKYCKCDANFIFSTATQPGTCVATSTNPAITNLCVDSLASTCIDNSYSGTKRCKSLAV
jgi:hypothetical protein